MDLVLSRGGKIEMCIGCSKMMRTVGTVGLCPRGVKRLNGIGLVGLECVVHGDCMSGLDGLGMNRVRD